MPNDRGLDVEFRYIPSETTATVMVIGNPTDIQVEPVYSPTGEIESFRPVTTQDSDRLEELTGVTVMSSEEADDTEATSDPNDIAEEFDSLEAATGNVNPLEDVEFEGKTKNQGLIDRGFTEKWTGVDSDGEVQTAFRNPRTGKWTGGHPSSVNDKFW